MYCVQIKRTLGKLPDSELARLGLTEIMSGNVTVLEGSPGATQLLEVWRQRQQEIKDAMAAVVKPAEAMAGIIKTVRDAEASPSSGSGSEEMILARLEELESFLEDVDSARDFHTIGGWVELADLLLTAPYRSGP